MRTALTSQWLKATTALTSAFGLAIAIGGGARANPLGGQVVAGEATISAPDAKTVQVDQSSSKAIVEWRSFNIDGGETTRFVQPDANAWTLNRVTGDLAPSVILGTIEANGNIAIVNPDGILFGHGARVDVGGLVATTNDIANDDFMVGRFHFTRPGNPSASIVNEGTISIADYGLAAFVAPGVRNSGVITARMGRVALASGNAFTLDLYGDDLIRLQVGDEIAAEVVDVATGQPVADLVKNEGQISANGGTVALKAATARRAVNSVVNNTGVIEANSVGTRGGKIVLGSATAGTKATGAPIQRVKVSGTLSAKNVPIPTPRPADGGSGGRIEITGEMIEVAAATVDVSGTNGGGTILIGGDYMGGRGDPATNATYGIRLEDKSVPTATNTLIDAHSTIKADALDQGDGGKVVVWADDSTSFAGTITARGVDSGKGGFVETSGATLVIGETAKVSTIAAGGKTGTWLLDPNDFTVSAAGGNVTGAMLSSQLTSTNITISTATAGTAGGNGDIFINDTVSWSSNLLTLQADRDIRFESAIGASGTAGLRLYFAQTVASGDLVFTAPVTLAASTSLQTRNGGGPLIDYTIISALAEFQAVGLTGAYALGTSIDASPTAGWNGGDGFVPIGSSANAFVGQFTGLGNVVSNITIDRSLSHSGLFAHVGATGVVRDVGIVGGGVDGGNITGSLVGLNKGTVHRSFTTTPVSGRDLTGALVGFNDFGGTISHSFATGDVSGRQSVGGLVGQSEGGTIDSSFATGDVRGIRHVGGLAGVAGGSISESYATGDVTGLSNVGGLVGNSDGTILDSYATGQVIGTGGHSADVAMSTAEKNTNIGGLIGKNLGTVQRSFANGSVSGGALVGGLAGTNDTGSILDSFATGTVSAGLDRVGGLVGDNAGGLVDRSYALGNVVAPTATRVGGLTGYSDGTLRESFATGDVLGNSYVGGLSGTNAGVVGDTFALGDVTGVDSVGGLVGYNGNSVSNSYSAGLVVGSGVGIGGLVGTNDFGAVVQAGFFDTDTSGQSLGCGVNNGLCDIVGLPSAQMKTAASFIAAGWDYSAVWNNDPAVIAGYPHLLTFVAPSPPLPPTLTFDPIPPSFMTMADLYQPTIPITGSGFTNISEIRWSWIDPNGVAGTAIWDASNAFGSGRLVINNDGSATISPVLVAAGDPPGTYIWTVTVTAGGKQVTRAFTVNYQKTLAPPMPPVDPTTPPVVPGQGLLGPRTVPPNLVVAGQPLKFVLGDTQASINLQVRTAFSTPNIIGTSTVAGVGKWTGTNGPLTATELVRELEVFLDVAGDAYTGGAGVSWDSYTSHMGLSTSEANELKRLGFNARVYDIDGNIYIGFEGSARLLDVLGKLVAKPEDSSDWLLTNLPNFIDNISNRIGIGAVTTGEQVQYLIAYALTIAVIYQNEGKEIYLTGHSLGGGMAAYVGAVLDLPAVTFNPAGVTLSDSEKATAKPENVLNLIVSGGGAAAGSYVGRKVVISNGSALPWPFQHPIGAFMDILKGRNDSNIVSNN